MPTETRVVGPGPKPRTVRLKSGELLEVPDDWELLQPGDSGLTRKVKAGGPTWGVQVKRGHRLFSQGVWAPAARIASARAEVSATRATGAYQRRRESDTRRRQEKQEAYVDSFEQEVRDFLAFPPCHGHLAEALARQVAEQATPVGSGTVARTERIPLHERAESAVIAWLRHHTTIYDAMTIPRVRGQRREVRRALARESRRLLDRYRAGEEPGPSCPLLRALGRPGT